MYVQQLFQGRLMLSLTTAGAGAAYGTAKSGIGIAGRYLLVGKCYG